MDYQSRQKIKNKTVLVTGGTGSFGSALTSYLIKLAPKKIIIFSRDELKQFEMRTKYASKKLAFVIGDVRDKQSVQQVMKGVDIVFHAAALKQVPSGEFFPIEAVKTNIFGSQNVIEAAIGESVKRVVFLSTDKAVYPINAMGMSKAIMEKLVTSLAGRDTVFASKTTFCVVRYGNVLYSRGSVVPLFVSQILQRGKLTITDPSMTRFLLSLDDAVELVLHALTKGKHGSTYVKKAHGASVETIAKALCQLFEVKERFTIIGARAGEKYHETLLSSEELQRAEDTGNFYHLPVEARQLDYERFFSVGTNKKMRTEGYASSNTKQLSVAQTTVVLKRIPEVKAALQQWKKR